MSGSLRVIEAKVVSRGARRRHKPEEGSELVKWLTPLRLTTLLGVDQNLEVEVNGIWQLASAGEEAVHQRQGGRETSKRSHPPRGERNPWTARTLDVVVGRNKPTKRRTGVNRREAEKV
jgi:hypothetical protein